MPRKTPPSPTLDLDLDEMRAARREALDGSFRFRLGGETFVLPAGLAVDVLEPLQPVLPGLVEILRPVLDPDAGDDAVRAVAVRVLTNGDMPSQLIGGIVETCRRIFNTDTDEGQWGRLVKVRPTVDEAIAIGRALWSYHGASLGELFRSATSSVTAGATLKQTSPDTSTDSTPATPSVQVVELPASPSDG